VLHAGLLPLNVIRLRQVRQLVDAVGAASDDEAIRALIPYMKSEEHSSGDVLFKLGDPADKLYVIEHGRVVFPEIGKGVGPGAVLGEVGLFAAGGTRSLTALCEGDCRVWTITKKKTLESGRVRSPRGWSLREQINKRTAICCAASGLVPELRLRLYELCSIESTRRLSASRAIRALSRRASSSLGA
jgi:CRP-like cAMP-binding protein